MDLRQLFASAVLWCGLAVVTGCAGKPAPEQAAGPTDNQSKPAANSPPVANANPRAVETKPAPVAAAPTARRALKPASELKVPAGLEEPPSEMKMAKSAWEYTSQAQVGDYAELEMSGTKMRVEIFDIADMAVMQIMDMTAPDSDKPMRIVTKMLFTEPELDPSSEHYVKFEKKPSNRKFTIGGKEHQADTVTEGYRDGKLVSKTWTSKQVPIGSLQMEDGEGKVTSRLLSFGRK